MRNGTYKITADFEDKSAYTNVSRIVRDINFTPADQRLPDIGICRIFSSRADADIILAALTTQK